MKYWYFTIALFINLGSFLLSTIVAIGGFELLIIPGLSVFAAILIVQLGATEIQKRSGWWWLWGTLASFPVMLILVFLAMQGHC